MPESASERFLRALCERFNDVLVIFFIATIFLLLSLGGVVVIDPSTPAYVLTVVNAVILSAFTLSSGAVLWKCWAG